MTDGRQPVNRAASVRARLLNLARQRHVEFQLVLSDFEPFASSPRRC